MNEEQVIKLLKEKPYKIGHLLGYEKLTKLHNEWMQEFIYGKNDFTLRAHRGSYKTTAIAVALTILLIVKPNETILFLRKTETDVIEIIKAVSKCLKSDVIQAIVKILYKTDLFLLTDTTSEISTNLKTDVRGTAQLTALGSTSSLTGKHYERIYTDDICFIGNTKIATPYGDKPIQDLKINDLVLTPVGYKKIIAMSNHYAEVITKHGLTGTYNHPIYNNLTQKFDFLINSDYDNLSIINLKDLIKWKIAEILSSGMDVHGRKQTENILFYGQIINTGLAKCFIEQYGNLSMVKSLKAMLYIIKTIMHIIITLIIWNVYRGGNIKAYMQSYALNGLLKILKKAQDQLCENGRNQKRGKKDLKKWASKCIKKQWKILYIPLVKDVEKITKCIRQREQDCVEDAANLKLVKDYIKKNNLKKKNVIFKLIVMSVVNYLIQTLQQGTEDVKIVKNEKDIDVNKLQKVYNIHVDDINVYYANGILVHNCNIKDRTSSAERNRTKLIYMELQNLKNRGGKIVNTGTPWHKEDCFSIMPPAKDYNCYTTGLMSDIEINEIKKRMTPSLFAANYEMKHISDDNALFKQAKYTDEIELIYDGVGHIDARYQGDDFVAYTIIKEGKDGKFYGFGKLYDRHVDDCINDIKKLHETFRAGSIYCEKNADKGYLREKLQNNGFIAHSYHEKMNKHIKICTILYHHWDNIYWIKGTDHDYINQILDYNEFAEHDDAPDGVASILNQITTKKVTIIEGLRL